MIGKKVLIVILICTQIVLLVLPSPFTPPVAKALRDNPSFSAAVTAATGPLKVSTRNARYFADPGGNIIYLTGSHTWCDFMDCDDTNPIVTTFDYNAFLNFLVANHHNFFRLWRAENARGGETGSNFWFSPLPYQRSSTCCAFDGGNKFNLSLFNQTYFDRMRSRVIAARDRGIYVSIMLFDGWSVESKTASHNPWAGHPYNLTNNINGIDGDSNNDNQGGETHTLAISQITSLQEAYVRKVIDTVGDLDNVLYETSNESSGSIANTDWQYHMINYIKSYEASKAKQHPVGMTWQYPDGDNNNLYNSPADWISIGENSGSALLVTPPVADGSKVVLADTDHLCGLCGSSQWVWKSFTRGENPLFMDPYDGQATGRGAPANYNPNNTNDVSLRLNLGYARSYANRINLAAVTPQPALCSTGYCLANAVSNGAEYLAYLPSGGSVNVNLSATPGSLSVEWFDPATGAATTSANVTGGAPRSLTAPFSGDAILYLKSIIAPPSNDDINSAKVITNFPYEDISDISGATVAADDPVVTSQCDGSYLAKGAKSVWYRYSPSRSGPVYMDTMGTVPDGFDTYIAVWTGTRGSLTFVACDNNSTTNDAKLAFNATGGTTYFIEVAEYNGIQNGPSVPLMGGTLKFHITTFIDVPGDYWAWRYIEGLSNARITSGCNNAPRSYCPGVQVSRDQMAVFLLRAKHGASYFPPAPTGIFGDVPTDYWAAAWIEELATEGITSGCNTSPKLYCPTVPVSRDQMALFLLRAKYGSAYAPPPPLGTFTDVPTDYWAAAWIEELVTEGITSGCNTVPKMYCPAQAVSRDQMAVFLDKTFALPLLP